MTAEPKRGDALQFIFSLFLGLLLVVVIGVGVWTFYPQPFDENSPEQERIEELYKQQEQLGAKTGDKPMTSADQAKSRAIQDEIDEINDSMVDVRDDWTVITSIILLCFATVLMAVSLFLPEHLRVFSNGVLLGGLFTVVYGTGWSFAGGDSKARFYVVLAALVLSVTIGYLRFIRGRKDKAAEQAVSQAAPTGAEPSLLLDLTARVAELERRAAAAAAALGDPEDH